MNKHQVRTQLVDWIGNDPESWQYKAEALITSRNVLASARKKADGDFNWFEEIEKPITDLATAFCPAPPTLFTELMLTGFAIENLLKGLSAASGVPLYESGTMIKGTTRIKFHDLLGMAKAQNFALTPAEANSVKVVQEVMIGIGRYPLRTSEATADKIDWTHVSESCLDTVLSRLHVALRVRIGPKSGR